MDIYTKFILTIIAVGIIGVNYHLFNGEIISSAKAATNEIHKIAICNETGTMCTRVNSKGILQTY
jgi:hypothetical protein